MISTDSKWYKLLFTVRFVTINMWYVNITVLQTNPLWCSGIANTFWFLGPQVRILLMPHSISIFFLKIIEGTWTYKEIRRVEIWRDYEISHISWHLPTPGLIPSFWDTHSFLSEYNYTEDITGKKADWIIKDRELLRHVLDFMHAFLHCLSNLGATDVNQRFLVSESNFCWYYWRTYFHIFNIFITYNFNI